MESVVIWNKTIFNKACALVSWESIVKHAHLRESEESWILLVRLRSFSPNQVLWFWYGFLILMGLFRLIDRVAQVLSWRFRFELLIVYLKATHSISPSHTALIREKQCSSHYWKKRNEEIEGNAMTLSKKEKKKINLNICKNTIYSSSFKIFSCLFRCSAAGISWSSGRSADILSKRKTMNR